MNWTEQLQSSRVKLLRGEMPLTAAERQRRYRKLNEANAKLKECETDDVDRHVVDDKKRIKKESNSNKTRKQLSESCETNRAKSRKKSYRASKLSRCDR